jgi:hypothetical protein
LTSRGPVSLHGQEPTIWDQKAADDFGGAMDAIESRENLLEQSAGLKEICTNALDEIDMGILGRNLKSVERNWHIFLPALKEMIGVTHQLNEHHVTIERGLTFTCKAYKLRAREAEKINRMHAGMVIS